MRSRRTKRWRSGVSRETALDKINLQFQTRTHTVSVFPDKDAWKKHKGPLPFEYDIPCFYFKPEIIVFEKLSKALKDHKDGGGKFKVKQSAAWCRELRKTLFEGCELNLHLPEFAAILETLGENWDAPKLWEFYSGLEHECVTNYVPYVGSRKNAWERASKSQKKKFLRGIESHCDVFGVNPKTWERAAFRVLMYIGGRSFARKFIIKHHDGHQQEIFLKRNQCLILDKKSSGMTTGTPHFTEQPWDGCVIAFDVCPTKGNLTIEDLREALESKFLSQEMKDRIFVNPIEIPPREEWAMGGPFKRYHKLRVHYARGSKKNEPPSSRTSRSSRKIRRFIDLRRRMFDERWQLRYNELVAYKKEHGDCQVPFNCKENEPLGKWVARQRSLWNTRKMSDDRMKLLDKIDFEFDLRARRDEDLWQLRYDELVAYKKEHGDCLVPPRHKENEPLGRWVHSQRTHWKASKLSEDRTKLLVKIGFEFDRGARIDDDRCDLWHNRYDELVAYKKEHKNCLVPQVHKENESLGTWVRDQRVHWRDGALSEERTKLLENIDFEFEPYEKSWQLRYDELVAYKKEHGDCMVPKCCKENEPLGRWVTRQRYLWNAGKLSKDRTKLLDKIGFVFFYRI